MAVSRLGRDLLGLIEQAHRVVVEPRCRLRARTRDGGKLGEQRVDALHGARGIAAGALDQARGHALIVFGQTLGVMLRVDLMMVHEDPHRLRPLPITISESSVWGKSGY